MNSVSAPLAQERPRAAHQGSGEIRLVNITKSFGTSQAVTDINLTIPHKVAVMQHLDEITPTARKIGAARGGR